LRNVTVTNGNVTGATGVAIIGSNPIDLSTTPGGFAVGDQCCKRTTIVASACIFAPDASVTNCTARNNGNDGIFASSGVVALCLADSNNLNANGSVDIDAAAATRTGNNPAP